MKHCTKCGRQYQDPSLKFCTEDGTPLTQFDSEAETLRVPQWEPEDIVMEIGDYLRRLGLSPGEERLIRFDDLKPIGLTSHQVSEYLPEAVKQLKLELVNQTETRATVRRPPPAVLAGGRIIRA